MDETHTDQEVMDYIDESYQYVCGNRAANEWIVPAKPNYYDVCEEFDHNDIVLWKQSTNIRTGDIVYLYVMSPVSAILYRGRVLETGIPYEYQDENMKISFAIKLQVLNRYGREKYGLEVLKKYGVNSVRGPRYMTKELSRMVAEQNDN